MTAERRCRALQSGITRLRVDEKGDVADREVFGPSRLGQGAWVLIFPEGTRVPVGQIGKFSRGGAALAANAGLPVLPVAHDAGRYWPKDGWGKTPGTVRVVFGPPLQAEGEGPRAIADLNERAFAWVAQTQRELGVLTDNPMVEEGPATV